MPEFIVSVMHFDPMEEERCLNRFIWEAPGTVEAAGRLEVIKGQLLQEAQDDFECDREDINFIVEPLEDFLRGYRRRGVLWEEVREGVLKYAFVREGEEVLWEDPDGGFCSGPKRVKVCTGYRDDDSTVLLSELDGSGETEVYYCELKPKGT